MILLIGFGMYNIFFSKVNFEYLYDGVIDLSGLSQTDYENLTSHKAYLFNFRDKWFDFRNKYLVNDQISKFKFSWQFLVVFTDLNTANGYKIYEISKINKRFLSLNINLNPKGSVDKTTGFSANARNKIVMIYKVDVGLLSGLYSPKTHFK
ncbi:MAG: hypothetical protein Q8920_13890 [Bacillota bacterium]|nr:hypothetical protein [Bacillota bacterium]